MSAGSSLASQGATLVLRNIDVSVLAKILNQQKLEGQAAVKLIASSEVGPTRGAAEPGKGSLVDLVA